MSPSAPLRTFIRVGGRTEARRGRRGEYRPEKESCNRTSIPANHVSTFPHPDAMLAHAVEAGLERLVASSGLVSRRSGEYLTGGARDDLRCSLALLVLIAMALLPRLMARWARAQQASVLLHQRRADPAEDRLRSLEGRVAVLAAQGQQARGAHHTQCVDTRRVPPCRTEAHPPTTASRASAPPPAVVSAAHVASSSAQLVSLFVCMHDVRVRACVRAHSSTLGVCGSGCAPRRRRRVPYHARHSMRPSMRPPTCAYVLPHKCLVVPIPIQYTFKRMCRPLRCTRVHLRVLHARTYTGARRCPHGRAVGKDL